MMERYKKTLEQIKAIAVIAALILTGATSANAQTVRIGVKDATFAKALVENLANEYNKLNMGVEIEVVNSGEADANVRLADNDMASVGKVIVLPIANSENEILTNKKLRKGVNEKVEKEIFIKPTYEEIIEAEEEGEKPLPGTVYAQSGSKAYMTQLFAEKLHTTPNKLKGKKILGSEENVLSVVRKQQDAISFNMSNLIYDLTDRHPQEGISVLSVDLDGNGKVTDEERAALADIDALNEYVGRLAHPRTPVGNVTIVSDNQDVKDFVLWAQTKGQEIVASLGFITVKTSLTAQR